VPHPYQLTSRLPLRELAAVLPRRRLKPRTYVLPIGSSILLGGYARVDAVAGPSANIYVTVFCADEVVTHMGKTAGADERRQRHAGGLLTPPFADDAAGAAEAVSGSGSGSDDEGGSSGGGSSGGGSSGGGGSAASRLAELGPLVPRTAVVEGASWKQHSKDVAIAGGCTCWGVGAVGWARCCLMAVLARLGAVHRASLPHNHLHARTRLTTHTHTHTQQPQALAGCPWACLAPPSCRCGCRRA
jgi:hypothetical protein